MLLLSSVVKQILMDATVHSGMLTKRSIVQRGVVEEFTEELIEAVGELWDKGTMRSPIRVFAAPHVKNVMEMIRKAQLRSGDGGIVGPRAVRMDKEKGLVVKETVLVQTIVDTIQEAIDAANDSDSSLRRSVWTRDLYLARKIAKAVRAGCTSIKGSTK
ncbi:hypothetical protein PQX77_011522 [Marasmius sp. AFHP31]|nr:hypothetical protein PQX77_011522 [Marasmius sp. AFHP31]